MSGQTWPALISALLRGQELSSDDTAWAMSEIMAGSATSAQIAGFAVALRSKGETAAEVSGLVRVMLGNAQPIDVTTDAVDVVGTGGDGFHTVNISTMSALVVAGAGVRVVKHGGRAASSACGAADLIEELGVPIDLTPSDVARCVTEAGIGFCFAATFHPGMRHAGVPRREMGIPTVFNFLGPLSNPARPRAGAIGCADERMAGVLAAIFADREGTALVLRGEDGMDEFSLAGPTRIWAASGGSVREFTVDAQDLGLMRATVSDLRGADAPYNAKVARALLAGERGAVRDAVLANSAAAIAAYEGFGDDLVAALNAGVQRAAEAIDSGSAAAVLDQWVRVANVGR